MYRLITLCSITLLTSGCGDHRQLTTLVLEADALVDGRPVHAATHWQIETTDTFPSGGVSIVRGVALAIPVAGRQHVYGLFQTLDGTELGPWNFMLLPVSNAIRREDEASGRTHPAFDKASSTFDYLKVRVGRRRFQICEAVKMPNRTTARPCPIFVYFPNPRNPSRSTLIDVGTQANLSGHTFKLQRVSVSFDTPESPNRDNSVLPTFVDPAKEERFAKIPGEINPELDAYFTTSDFWRA